MFTGYCTMYLTSYRLTALAKANHELSYLLLGMPIVECEASVINQVISVLSLFYMVP